MSQPAPVPINAFRVTVETTWGQLVPQVIAASNLNELFQKAVDLPLSVWLPAEDEEET